MATLAWEEYLTEFHRTRPGITEAAFEHARDEAIGTPYEWLARALPDPAGAVLDIACGNAAVQQVLSGCASYLGVDLSTAELDRARELGRGPVVRGDARALPVPDRSVDTVVVSMGLMLVRPLAPAVAEIARVLRPGGTVALLLPSLRPLRIADLPILAALSVPLRGPGSMPQRVSARRMVRNLQAAGLVVDGVRRHRFAFPVQSPRDAELAVRALYTPGRSPSQLVLAQRALARRAGPHTELPVPLTRIVARLPEDQQNPTERRPRQPGESHTGPRGFRRGSTREARQTTRRTTMRATWDGTVIAESDATVVVEGNHYFPPDSVAWNLLEASPSRSTCPWKGQAHYWSVVGAGRSGQDVAWSYPDPSPAARQIAGHVAFWRGVTVTAS